MPVFILATYYNIPLITWGITSSATLDDESRFPTAGMLSIGSRRLDTFQKSQHLFKRFNYIVLTAITV